MPKKRQTESKTYIRKALIRLLAEKKFEDITISDLTQTAGINRGTFYLHYSDKYDMAAKIKDETESKIFTILQKDNLSKHPSQPIKEMLDYLVRDLDFFSVVAKASYANFSASIKDFVFQLITSYPNWKEGIAAYYAIPEEYALEVYLASAESLITHWIAQGAKESTADMTDIILKVLFFERKQ